MFVVSGGGGEAYPNITHFRLTDTYPTYSPQGWQLFAHNDRNFAERLTVGVLCGT